VSKLRLVPSVLLRRSLGEVGTQPLDKLTSELGFDGEADFLSPYYGFLRSEVSNFFHQSRNFYNRNPVVQVETLSTGTRLTDEQESASNCGPA